MPVLTLNSSDTEPYPVIASALISDTLMLPLKQHHLRMTFSNAVLNLTGIPSVQLWGSCLDEVL